MAETDLSEITSNVRSCARCGGEREAVIFKKMSGPVIDSGNDEKIIGTHWAACPKNGDPILLGFKKKL
jgi:hypothetical protein